MHRINAWKKKLNQRSLSFHLRSQLTAPVTHPGIILWDTFGELRSAYGIAATVFVGGSLLPLGGQNFIEPVVLGTPAITGPYLDDFAWVGREIFSKKIVTQCCDWQQVSATMVSHLTHPPDKKLLKENAKTYIDQHTGGTRQACGAIIEAIQP